MRTFTKLREFSKHYGNGDRLLYSQFGKIKITDLLQFDASKGSKFINSGFQFEIDL